MVRFSLNARTYRFVGFLELFVGFCRASLRQNANCHENVTLIPASVLQKSGYGRDRHILLIRYYRVAHGHQTLVLRNLYRLSEANTTGTRPVFRLVTSFKFIGGNEVSSEPDCALISPNPLLGSFRVEYPGVDRFGQHYGVTQDRCLLDGARRTIVRSKCGFKEKHIGMLKDASPIAHSDRPFVFRSSPPCQHP